MSRPESFPRGADITFRIDLLEGSLADVSSVAVDLRPVGSNRRNPDTGAPITAAFAITQRNPEGVGDRGGWYARIPGSEVVNFAPGDYVAGPRFVMATNEIRYGKEKYITIFEPATVRV